MSGENEHLKMLFECSVGDLSAGKVCHFGLPVVEIGLLKAITIRTAGFSHVTKDQGDVILP